MGAPLPFLPAGPEDDPPQTPVNQVIDAQRDALTAGRDMYVTQAPLPVPALVRPEGPVVSGDIPREPKAFQPRPGLMEALQRAAESSQVAVICALTGARGVGKTQIAAAYARHCARQGWPLVAWVHAETDDQLVAGLDAVAADLGITVAGEDAAAGARRLKKWLTDQTERCLIVLDNVSDADLVTAWLPPLGAVQVVISSNYRSVEMLGTAVRVEVFTGTEALAFLRERADRPWQADDEVSARALAEEVDHLPLALAAAAYVINRQALGYDTYVERLRSVSLEEAFPKVPGDGYPVGAARAVLLALAEFASGRATRVERGLLELMAVVSPAGVPRAWLHRAADDRDLLGVITGDGAARVDAVIGTLADASLLVLSQDGATVSMHRFIQRVTRDSTRKKRRLENVVSAAAAWVEECKPPIHRVVWDRLDRESLIDQAATLHLHARSMETTGSSSSITTVLSLQNRAGQYLEAAGDLGRAIPLFEQILADRTRVLGADHPDTLGSRNNLASVYESAGDLGRAIPLYKQNLADSIRVLGADHPNTLSSRNNLAYLYHVAGDLKRAIPLYKQTLADSIRVLGADHPDTLGSRNNLAGAYQVAGDLERAIPLFEQTLSDFIRILGANHPSALSSRNNLASAYESAGDLGQAIPLYEQTLIDRTRVLGADHPNTLSSRSNLASAYQAAGALGWAIPLYEQAIADRTRVLGADHPDTLGSRNNLAGAYESAGDLERAILLYEQNFSDFIRVLGADHPNTLSSRNNLASAYESAGDLERAIPLYEQNLTDSIRVLGADHPNTLSNCNNLASAYESAGDLERAIPLYKQALSDSIRVLGQTHPTTEIVRKNLDIARDTR
ncbi:tetratricopeptide repeat protein [Streptosporangium sp. NBC_01756]|uniref:tetratricopeptide repeat protein n=1 Tax=Streptosporangium sp. NBC_01756 TaxID=2975950 RepID=UPI002DD9640D|nr:tetratricopeptide repeat protein [Streptosporangium sp. NBC_01756]WSC88245.1 tetratricopeptide repeat protein [Streptosporangium sp. NBC_01756]